MKVKNIAIKYNLSEANVKQKLFRARKKIIIRTLYKQGGNQYDK